MVSLPIAAFSFICVTLLKKSFAVEGDRPKVCVEDGCFVGIEQISRLNKSFDSFLGIPYAKPPIGDLRFRPPQKPDPWGTLETKKDGNICIQGKIFRKYDDPPSSEDCLYMNVHVPRLPGDRAERRPKFPVMVLFHPGGWMFWAGTEDYFPGGFLVDRDVILVMINYRLNILGFLSTEDDVAPGNWGLKDQVFALRWVRDNIAAFGGDPDNVTIFGASAGGASVHYHMLSPLARGLFNRVIATSGVSNARWAYALKGESREHAEYVARHFECPIDNSTVLVDCLREKPAEDLIDADTIFFVWNIHPFMKYLPTVEPDIEGAFLIGSPRDLLKAGNFTDVPFMIGMGTKEGTVSVAGIINDPNILKSFNVLRIKSYCNTLWYYHLPVHKVVEVTNKIRKFYFNNKDVTEKKANVLTDMFSDSLFAHPTYEAIEFQRQYQKTPIFKYSFEYKSPGVTFAVEFGAKDLHQFNGTSHLDEYLYLFPLERTFFKNYEWTRTEEEEKMVERMLDLWTNFALFGNPTPEGYDVTWDRVKTEKQEYLAIRSPDDIAMSSNLNPKGVQFWKELDLESVEGSYQHGQFVHEEL